MLCPPRNIIAAAALLALLGAQVFGLQRGFVCLCTDEAIETEARFCADEDEGCSHEENGIPCTHAPLNVKHEALGKTSSGPLVHAPALVAILDFKEVFVAFGNHAPATVVSARPPSGRCANPPASLQVAECKVLLI